MRCVLAIVLLWPTMWQAQVGMPDPLTGEFPKLTFPELPL
jgi:hypothetical protein